MATTTNYELKMGVATREAFGRTLAELGKTNKDIVVCDADLSKSTMTTYFAQAFPDRFFTCGIAESNMTAVAAGLAAAGKIPVRRQLLLLHAQQGLRATARNCRLPQHEREGRGYAQRNFDR